MAWTLKLKPDGAAPLYRRIEQSIRSGISEGRLKPGDRIPSVVDVAEELGINKLTVLKAFQRLEKAGIVRSEVGRGTFVASEGSPPAPPGAEPRPDVSRSIRRLREGYSRGLRELLSVERRPDTINLSGGVPSPDTIPDGLLEKLSQEVVRKNPRRLYEYGGPAGLPELREAIAATLSRRGMPIGPDEIIVTNGSQQAVSLTAAWAREEGRSVFCETPTYTGIPGSFMLFGHAVQSIPWERGAPDLDQLRSAAAGRRSLFYVCPDFHNPTGQTMDTASRHSLADWARTNDAVVVDDSIFREMRFEGDEPPSLYSLLPPGRRIVVGSISKSFMTGLRAGFLVADRAIVSELLPYKRYMDLGSPSIVQAIAAAFLRGGYPKHLEKMKTYYRTRRDAALKALEEFMPEGVTWTRPQGAFQLWVTMPRGVSSVQLFLQGIERGVSIFPGPAQDIDGRYLNSFRLGYGAATPEEIRTGVRRLGSIVESLVARGPEAADALGLGVMV
ncbi:MAG TPA: PLP-dependent aminotransferase family protein [Planctomycetota bacterium]|nr:PLP-dependent aminotransferase family protein [Planctomycetota bacterium]